MTVARVFRFTLLALCLLVASLTPARPALAGASAPPAPRAWLTVNPGLPVVGRPLTVYLHTYETEVDFTYRWDVRLRYLGTDEVFSETVTLERVNGEPSFWSGTLYLPSSGDWQLVVGEYQSEPWPTPGTAPTNLLIHVVRDREPLITRDVLSPWSVVIATGAAGTVIGALLGWLIGRGGQKK